MIAKNCRFRLAVPLALLLATAGVAMADEPASLGQQPIRVEVPVVTPTPVNGHQLQQLFQFPTTPDALDAGEGYVSGQFDYLAHLPGAGGIGRRGVPIVGDQFRLRLQGQYAITDHIAVGGYLPIIDNAGDHGRSGSGDLTAYGQYRLDQVIDPAAVDLTAQLDVVLPTGDYGEFRDTGRLGVRPEILAYKDFGLIGPGVVGAYGLVGFTIADRTDVHLGIAGTYEVAHFAGILEVYGVHAFGRRDRSSGTFTPGVAYRGFRNLDLALGIPIGLTDKSPDVGLTLKVTYAFPN